MPDARIGLVDYLTELQAELNTAHARAETDEHGLRVDSVTLELDVSFTRVERAGAAARTRLEFWVSEHAAPDANDDERSSPQARQRVTVRMSTRPDVADDALAENPSETSPFPPRPFEKPAGASSPNREGPKADRLFRGPLDERGEC